MGTTTNRWLVLAAAGVCNALVGALYIWSIFSLPLAEAYAWGPQETSLAYSLYLLVEGATGLVSGSLQTRVNANRLVFFGGCSFALGWFLAGFANSVIMLYLTFSLLGGMGSGFLYNLAVSVATKWFPDKRGFANGLCIGCIGLSPLLFAPLGEFFISTFGVSRSFSACGMLYLFCVLLCARFLKTPPDGWRPAGWQPSETETDCSSDMTTREAMRQPLFYLLWLILAVAASSGLMMTGHASGIGQAMAGLTSGQAAMLVGIMAVANFAGRLAFGTLSDIIGRFRTLFLVLAVTAATMLFFFGQVHDFITFTAALCTVGACFGGVMTTIPALCADIFGSKHFGQTYAFLFTGFTAASFIGPMLAASIFESTGAYTDAFTIAGALTCLGIALTAVALILSKRLAGQRG